MKSIVLLARNTILVALGLVTFSSCVNQETSSNESIDNSAVEAFEIISNKVFTTAHGTALNLSESGSITFDAFQQPLETQASIYVNTTKQHQSLLGIGAALTDAAAETYFKLNPDQQELFMKAYFDKEEGIGYTLARTIIHSCDFSSGSYTYIEEGDAELKTFSIEHDREFRIPFTKKAIEAAGGTLLMYASPWSPPAFMKTNNNMLQGGKLKREFYPAWASYYAKFIKAYEAEGVAIWGLSIQNEPMAVQRWESCIYTAEDERDFLRDHLGPTLEKEGLGDKKIIFTEGCNEAYDLERIEDPKLAERYGKAMINDFNNGTVAWTDWNILLDETGGPNHVGNLCFAPVIGDTNTGELLLTHSYYYIGHFSKFIRPGAKRLSVGTTANHLSATAFMNTDGSVVVVALNDSDNAIDYMLTINNKTARLKMPERAIQSIILN